MSNGEGDVQREAHIECRKRENNEVAFEAATQGSECLRWLA
jgi:hypothetical protein